MHTATNTCAILWETAPEMLIQTTLFSLRIFLIRSIARIEAIPPEKPKATERIRPVSKADSRHLEKSTQKQSDVLKNFPLLSMNNVIIFARPIFAPGQNGNGGISSSTAKRAREIVVNSAQVIILFVLFNLSPHQDPANPLLLFQVCAAYI